MVYHVTGTNHTRRSISYLKRLKEYLFYIGTRMSNTIITNKLTIIHNFSNLKYYKNHYFYLNFIKYFTKISFMVKNNF